MPRLFTALDLPPTAIDALRDFQHEQRVAESARWTPSGNLHLTLRFIGELGDEEAQTVETALTGVRPRAAIDVVPLGLGVLPSRRHPRVLTVRIDLTESLHALYRALQATLSSVGVEREKRPFRPHVTLARLKHASPERLYRNLRETKGPSLKAFTVDRFFLYESILAPEGAVHSVRATYPFDAD